MACGCVPVVVGYGGPAGLVTDACGVRLPLATKERLAASLPGALEALAADPERRDAFGRAARERAVREFSWDAKARKMVEVYEWVTGRRREKPEFESAGGADVSGFPESARPLGVDQCAAHVHEGYLTADTGRTGAVGAGAPQQCIVGGCGSS
jgi:hypothetical protein